MKHYQLKQLIKEIVSVILESELRGEWWFQGGQAIFADGDVGDMNHEAYVIDMLNKEILDFLGVECSEDRCPSIYNLKRWNPEILNRIFENIKDEMDSHEMELWNDEYYGEAIHTYLERKGDSSLKEKIKYALGSSGREYDAREYALRYWGWQRVKRNVIQTQTLTTKDLNHIVNGLWDAYGEEVDSEPEHTFNIEVMSTRSWYEGIPFSVLQKKNPTSLNAYRTRYE